MVDRAKPILRVYLRYVHYLLGVLCVVALLIIIYGYWYGNLFLTVIGSTLFSISAVSFLYRLLADDLFLRRTVEDLMIEKISMKGFTENELKELIKRSVQELGRGSVPSEVYDTVERNLIDKIGGVVARDYVYKIELEASTEYGPHLLRARIQTSYVLANESSVPQSLFDGDLVSEGQSTLPLAKPPEDLRGLYSVERFEIDGAPVDPETQIEWADPEDTAKGIRYRIRYRRTLHPSERVHVSLVTKTIMEKDDYLLRRFTQFRVGQVELAVSHPRDIDVSAAWFITTAAVLQRPMMSTTTFLQRAEGVFLPSNGFLLIFRTKGGKQ